MLKATTACALLVDTSSRTTWPSHWQRTIALCDRLFCRMQDVSKSLAEQRVRSDDLASKHKGRRNKQERLATVMAGVSRCLWHLHSAVVD